MDYCYEIHLGVQTIGILMVKKISYEILVYFSFGKALLNILVLRSTEEKQHECYCCKVLSEE